MGSTHLTCPHLSLDWSSSPQTSASPCPSQLHKWNDQVVTSLVFILYFSPSFVALKIPYSQKPPSSHLDNLRSFLMGLHAVLHSLFSTQQPEEPCFHGAGSGPSNGFHLTRGQSNVSTMVGSTRPFTISAHCLGALAVPLHSNLTPFGAPLLPTCQRVTHSLDSPPL